MKNSKLYKLVQHLNLEEICQLELYLQSPFFIDQRKKELHTKSVKLFFLIQKNNREIEALTREKTFAQLYPNRTFNLNKLNQVMMYLVKQIEAFLVYEYEHKGNYYNAIRQKLSLLNFYAEQKMSKWYEAQKRDIQKFQAKINYRDNFYYINEYFLNVKSAQINSVYTDRRANVSLQQLVVNLQNFYNLSLLNLACIIKSGTILNEDELRFIEQSLVQIDLQNQEYNPIIKIYFYALKLIEGKGNNTIYQTYKSLLMEYHACFDVRDLKGLFTYALNYCLIQLNSGKEEYYEECWKMYCLGFEKSILYVEKKILPSDLKNIITLSLRLEKYEWAEEFLYKHKNKIEAENPKEVYSFNLANVFFYQQKYDEMHRILRILKCKDIFYELALRRLEIKALYEEEEINLLYAKLNAYRVFIHRNGVLDKGSKEMNNNFLNILNKLVKIIPRDKQQICVLKQTLDNMPKLAERKWIATKLEELKK